MEGFRVSYTKQFFALFGPISLWTFWPNHNMSASQLPSVWCDDPTARAKMQHLRAMICKANSTTLTFLLLFQLLVQVWDSYLRGPLKQKITYADMLHRSVNGYVEKWHANTTAEHKKNKQKKKQNKKWMQQRSTCVRRGGQESQGADVDGIFSPQISFHSNNTN